MKREKIANTYLEVFLAALREYGIEGKTALHMVRSLRAAIGGFIELELRGGVECHSMLMRAFDSSSTCLLQVCGGNLSPHECGKTRCSRRQGVKSAHTLSTSIGSETH